MVPGQEDTIYSWEESQKKITNYNWLYIMFFHTQICSDNYYQSIQIKSIYDQVKTFQSFTRNTKIDNIERDYKEMWGK